MLGASDRSKPKIGLSKEEMIKMCRGLSEEEVLDLIVANNNQIYKDLMGKIYKELKNKALSDRNLIR